MVKHDLDFEVVDIDPKHMALLRWLYKKITHNVLATVVVLDVVDIFAAHVPYLNAAWDIITFGVLLLVLRKWYLGIFALLELLLMHSSLWWVNMIDGFLPIALILYLVDIELSKVKFKVRSFHKEFDFRRGR